MSQPISLPLLAPIGARYQSLTVDSRVVNAFIERDPVTQAIWVYKRPGFASRSTALPAGVARGIYNWNGAIYAIVGALLYKDGVALSGAINATGFYTFAPGLGAAPQLFFHNATNAYVVDGAGTITAVTDVDYPATTVSGAGYLNGTFYVMGPDAKIQSSDATNNDALTWAALDFIVAEAEGVAAVALAKQLVYIIAFKQFFIETFYDAGNPTGSPLATVQGAKMNYGLRDARSLANCGGDLVFVSVTQEGSVQVVKISSLQAQVVSTPPVERLLEHANYTTVYSWGIRCEGHRFYVITLAASNITLALDLTNGFWYQWTDPNGNYLPYAFATIDTNNKAVLIHESTGELFNPDPLTFGDDGVAFPVDIYTPNFTGGTVQERSNPRIDFIGDRVANSSVDLRWSDDDYRTWSSPVTVSMDLERPTIADLGAFYRRAFHVRHSALTSFRLEKIVMYAGMGT